MTFDDIDDSRPPELDHLHVMQVLHGPVAGLADDLVQLDVVVAVLDGQKVVIAVVLEEVIQELGQILGRHHHLGLLHVDGDGDAQVLSEFKAETVSCFLNQLKVTLFFGFLLAQSSALSSSALNSATINTPETRSNFHSSF